MIPSFELANFLGGQNPAAVFPDFFCLFFYITYGLTPTETLMTWGHSLIVFAAKMREPLRMKVKVLCLLECEGVH